MKRILLAVLFLTFSTQAFSAVDDANTISLLHFDGSHGSADFIDESGKTWLVYGTGLTITTADKKFGTGAANRPLITDCHLYHNNDSSFHFGTGDFTIEAWVNGPSNSQAILFYGYVGETLKTYFGVFWNNAWFYDFDSGIFVGCPFEAYDGWAHVAVVRNGDTFTVYVNGNAGTPVTSSSGLPEYTKVVCYEPFDVGNMKIDEWRASKVARWTSNFTPSAEAYQPKAPEPATAYFGAGSSLHFAGNGSLRLR